MFWLDILVEGTVGDANLRCALADTFKVASDDVCVVTELEAITPNAVVCHRQMKGGQFSLMLSIYLPTSMAPPNPDVASGELSRRLQKRLLLDAGSPDPYRMCMVDGADRRDVDLNVEALDERDEYTLASS